MPSRQLSPSIDLIERLVRAASWNAFLLDAGVGNDYLRMNDLWVEGGRLGFTFNKAWWVAQLTQYCKKCDQGKSQYDSYYN